MKRHVNMRTNSGFTLIELLIAAALLSMVILVGSMSYGLFASNWNKELGHYKTSVAFTRDLESLRKVIASSFPLVIGDSGKNALYWQGNKDSLQAASLTGFFIDEPVIYRLEIQPNDQGIKQLVYFEAASNQILLDSQDKAITFEYRRVIIDNLDTMSIQYWGWKSHGEKSTKLSNTGNAVRKWHSQYNSVQTKLFPERVKLAIVYQNANLEKRDIVIQAQFFSNAEIGLNDQ